MDRVHDKGLFAPMVEDRGDDIASVGQRPAHLDLAVAPVEATAELEDPPRPRRAADGDLRALAQLGVGRLGPNAVGLVTGEPLDGSGGKRLRSFAVILRIVSDPSFS